MTLGVVTGMRAEAALVRRHATFVASTGGRLMAADAKASELLARGATALVSFGIAGGLAPELAPGDLVIASAVVVRHTAPIAADPAWCARLAAALPGARCGLVLGGDRILGTATQKAGLFARTGALAVDLESAGVARAAASAGVPFVVLRAIADPATRDLPPAALIGLTPAGRIALGKILVSLWRDRSQLAQLLQIGRDARAARAALLRGVRQLGAGLGMA
jgi:hopanoid-associated phosphorylase